VENKYGHHIFQSLFLATTKKRLPSLGLELYVVNMTVKKHL